MSRYKQILHDLPNRVDRFSSIFKNSQQNINLSSRNLTKTETTSTFLQLYSEEGGILFY